MGEELKGMTFSFARLNEETGEYETIGTLEKGLEINLERETPIRLEDGMKFRTSYEGTFKIKHPKKMAYDLFGVKNSYYKHLKRVENRKKLHMKRGK